MMTSSRRRFIKPVLYRNSGFLKFSSILRVTEKDVSFANMMFGFHYISGLWDDKLFLANWGSAWIGHSKLFSQLSDTYNRWIINNVLCVFDNFKVTTTKYLFDKSVAIADIEAFVKSRITPGEASEIISLKDYKEYLIPSPRFLSYKKRTFDCGGIPEDALDASQKAIDNVTVTQKPPNKVVLMIYPKCKNVSHTVDKRNSLKQYMCDMGSKAIIPEQYFGVLRSDSADYDNPHSAVICQIAYRKRLYTRYTLSGRLGHNPAPLK